MLTAGAMHNTGDQHLVVCGSDEISIDDTPYGVQPALDACNTGLLHVGIKLGVMLSMLGENQSSN
jgi:hypothetical protein